MHPLPFVPLCSRVSRGTQRAERERRPPLSRQMQLMRMMALKQGIDTSLLHPLIKFDNKSVLNTRKLFL